jgi:hypothetical protein
VDATHPTRRSRKGADLETPTTTGDPSRGRYWDQTSDLSSARDAIAQHTALP